MSMQSDSSYSTIMDRASHYLAETLSACFSLGFKFTIRNEGYVTYAFEGGETGTIQIQSAFTPAAIAAATADALAEVLSRIINDDTDYSPHVTHEIVIENGAFLNAHNGERFADDAKMASDFCERFPHVRIKIVSAYD